ncbi:MAG: SDR family oxidoreductase [Planctomycetota bacterium]
MADLAETGPPAMPPVSRRVVVTGGGSGIGASIARRFANDGHRVWVVDRNTANAQSMAQKVGGSWAECDVADEASCEALAEQVRKAAGGVDTLVNNAGIGHVGTIEQTTAEDLDRLHAVNVRGVFNMSQTFLPLLRAGSSSTIVNLASIGGVVGIRDRLAYCATKFAVVGITKAMALDHAAEGLRVNCVCPGRVETPFVQQRIEEYSDPEAARREMASTQALGRMARPEEIADAAFFLGTDRSSFVTGSALIVDGGWSAGK